MSFLITILLSITYLVVLFLYAVIPATKNSNEAAQGEVRRAKENKIENAEDVMVPTFISL
jgi:hypothetical protein